MEKKGEKIPEVNKNEIPWNLVAIFAIFSLGVGAYFIYSQNYFGGALFVLMPALFVLTKIK